MSANGSRIVGPAQLVGHAGGSGGLTGHLTVGSQLAGHLAGSSSLTGDLTVVRQLVGHDQGTGHESSTLTVAPAPNSDRARELNAAEEGLRAILAAGAMQMAVTDWGWTGFDATLFALAVWCAVGWLLRQH
jgi:hypothetical protein